MTDQVRRYLPPCQRQLSDEDIHAFCLSVWKSTRSVGLIASTAISSRSRCFARGSPSLKARGKCMSICRGTWDGFTPFSRALAGSWSPRVRFSSTHRRFFWTGRRDFISCFWGGGKCHLSALLSWWKSLRGGYLGNRSITSRLAAGARDLQTVKVRRQISVGWPGGGASATVSPLLRWSPWRGSSFMKKNLKKTRAVFLCRRSTRSGLCDDAPDWRHFWNLAGPQICLSVRPSRRPVPSAVLWLPWFHGETSVAQPHGHQGQRPHFPPRCPHLTFRAIWRCR